MPAKKLTVEQLRAIKHQVAILKKNGVVPKSTDVRSIKPTRHYRDLIKKNQDIIQGTAKGVKVSKTKAEEFKQAGYRVKNSRVVVNVKPGEKASYSHGNVYLNRKLQNGEIQRIVLPRRYEDFLNWVEGDTHDPLLSAMKHNDEKFAFRFFGNNSYSTYNSWDQLMRDVREQYKSVIEAHKKGDIRSQEQIVANIEIVRVKSTKTWTQDSEARTQKTKSERQRARRAWNKQKGKSERKPGQRGPDKSPRAKRTYAPPPPLSSLELAEKKLKNAASAAKYRAKKKAK